MFLRRGGSSIGGRNLALLGLGGRVLLRPGNGEWGLKRKRGGHTTFLNSRTSSLGFSFFGTGHIRRVSTYH